MKLIQPVLIISIVIFLIVYFARGQSRIIDRILLLILTSVGIIFIAVPEWSNQIAHLFGVDNGGDLISYFALVGLGIIALMLYAKLREIDEKLTRHIRSSALEHVNLPEVGDEEQGVTVE